MLDINEIVQSKLTDLAESKTIETEIQKTIESTILKEVRDTFSSYEFRKVIGNRLTAQFSQCFEKIDFSSYNGFILNALTSLIETRCKQDIIEKAKQQINDMLFVKRESIKLSWLANKYTEYLNDRLDEEDKYDVGGRWYFEVLEDVSEHVSGLKEIVMGLSKPERRYSGEDHLVRLRVWDDERIYRLSFEDKDMKNLSTFGGMSDFEALLFNLVMNETKIEWDDLEPPTSLDIDY